MDETEKSPAATALKQATADFLARYDKQHAEVNQMRVVMLVGAMREIEIILDSRSWFKARKIKKIVKQTLGLLRGEDHGS